MRRRQLIGSFFILTEYKFVVDIESKLHHSNLYFETEDVGNLIAMETAAVDNMVFVYFKMAKCFVFLWVVNLQLNRGVYYTALPPQRYKSDIFL